MFERIILRLVVAVLITALASASPLIAGTPEISADVKTKEVPQSVVLYTIHRGNYEEIGPILQGLMQLALQKGIEPVGPISFMYLNDPRKLEPEHWLTELRVPVDASALALDLHLDKMTAVKRVSGWTVAAVTKPEGMANPGPLYEALFRWVGANDYELQEGPFEVFHKNAETGNYTQMETEIMVPIKPLPAK